MKKPQNATVAIKLTLAKETLKNLTVRSGVRAGEIKSRKNGVSVNC